MAWGNPWNRRAVIAVDGGAEQHFDAVTFAAGWQPGTRRIAKMTTDLGGGRSLTLTPTGPVFAIGGLGYTHPCGVTASTTAPSLPSRTTAWRRPSAAGAIRSRCTSEALVTAELVDGGTIHRGAGVLEQLFVGPHGPTGLTPA